MMFDVEGLSKLINRDTVSVRVVGIQVPEEGVDLDVLLNKEIISVVPDDVVVKAGLPDPSVSEQAPCMYVLGYGGFVRTNDG
jgi:hypothetical protein